MSLKIYNEEDATVEQILEEGRQMWGKVREASRTKMSVENLYSKLWKENNKFCLAYPLVVGEMVQGRYHTKAMKLYLKYVSSQPFAKDRDIWLRTQAHYLNILYKQIVPHYDVRNAVRAEEDAYRKLKAEDADWENNVEDIQRELAAEKDEIADLKREEIRRHLAKLRGDTPAAATDDAADSSAMATIIANIDGEAGKEVGKGAGKPSDKPSDEPSNKLLTE